VVHSPFFSDFLFLGWATNGPWFLEIAHDGQMNWHTTARFAAIGSGGEFATVAQALMGHYQAGTSINVDDGVLIAHRAISTTCEVSSAFVGLPVWIATATSSSCRVLDTDEIDEIGERVEGWKQIELDSLLSLRAAAPGEDVQPLPSIAEGDAGAERT
jgi:hypothetical protein